MLDGLIDDFYDGDHLSPQRMSKRLRLPLVAENAATKPILPIAAGALGLRQISTKQ